MPSKFDIEREDTDILILGSGGAGLFAARQPTLPFNGYGDQVASLYAGMDLRANY